MSIRRINEQYGLSCVLGQRVLYTGGREPKYGTLTGTRGARLLIMLDGGRIAGEYHPTWELMHLQPAKETAL